MIGKTGYRVLLIVGIFVASMGTSLGVYLVWGRQIDTVPWSLLMAADGFIYAYTLQHLVRAHNRRARQYVP